MPTRTPVSLALLALFLTLSHATPALGGKTEGPEKPLVEPAWTFDFENPVRWQRVTPFGTFIVNTTAGLYGVDPESGEVVWGHRQLAPMPHDRIESVPGSPLVVMDDGTEDPRVVVLDTVTGTLVFDSKAAGLVQVLDRQLLERSGKLLIVGFEPGKPKTTLFLFDVLTGEMVWRSDALHRDSGKLMTLFTSLMGAATDASPLSTEPIELDDTSFLLAAMGDIYRMRIATGEVLWKARFFSGSPYTLFTDERRPGLVYAGSQVGGDDYTSGTISLYQGFRLMDGSPVWKQPVRVPGAMNAVAVFSDRGLIVSEGTTAKGKIRLLHYEDGTSLWGKKGKGIKASGGIVDYAWTDAGLVLTTGYDNAWMNKGTEYYLYVLDVNTGTFRFEKPLEVRGRMLATETVSKGVLYITTHEIGVLDPTTGQPLSKTVVRAKDTPLVTANAGSHLFAFSADDGGLFRVDRHDGTIAKLFKGSIALKGKDTPASLEVTGDRITLLSSQNVVSFGLDGSLRFHAYHPAPSQPAIMRALLAAQAVRAAMASVASGMSSAAFATAAAEAEGGSVGEAVSAGMSEGYMGLAGRYADAARVRFRASVLSREFVFMMVQSESRGYGLAKVSKKTGEIVGIIDMAREKQPSYEVDDIANRIYYRKDPTVIVSYEF